MDQSLSLNNLQKGREKRPVIVRVVRKWTMTENQGQGEPLYVGMVFTDAQGGAIYAEIPLQFMSLKEDLFQIGEVYKVMKFKVRNNKQHFKVLDRPLMIEISEQTTAESVMDPPRNIPERVYRLTDFEAVVPSEGLLVQYTDVIGYLIKYTDLDTFVPKNREKVIMLRELYIKDLRNNVLKVTIWGDHATNFNIDHVYDEKSGNIVVCLILGCTPKREFKDYNKIYLSASQPFCCYLNPQVPEASDYYARFKHTPIFIDRPAVTDQPRLPPPKNTTLEMKTLAELNSISDPYEFEDGTYKCTVTISSVAQGGKWWYMACKPCKKKAIQQFDGSYKCSTCGGTNTAARYLLTFWGTDDTAEARFFAHDTEAKIIVGRDCESLMNPLGFSGALPQQILDIVGKKYVFSIDLDDETVRQYVVKAILMKPARRPVQGTAIASSSSNSVLIRGSETAEHVGTSDFNQQNESDVLHRPQLQLLQNTPPPPITPVTPKTNKTSETARETSNARKNLTFADDVQQNKESLAENEAPSDDEVIRVAASSETPLKRPRGSGGKQSNKNKSTKSAPETS